MKKLEKKKIMMCVITICGLLSVGCKRSEVNAAQKIKISEKKLTLTEGETSKLKITGTDKKVKWKSQNPKVAKITSKGKVIAKKKGTTKIIAKVGKKKYICKVKVVEAVEPRISMYVGEKYKPEVLNATKKIKWSSDKPEIVKVNKKGKLTAVSLGSTCIYIKCGKTKTKFWVDVIPNSEGKHDIGIIMDMGK